MNVIANAFAFKGDCGASEQVAGSSDDGRYDIYMKNIVVSLVSAKKQNPDDEVMLVCNAEPPGKYKTMLEENGVVIKICPFDKYILPDHFKWALAFYKLCALEYLTTLGYGHILLIDTDTYTTQSYKEMWKDADHGLMLLNIGHSFDHAEREKIRKNAEILVPERKDHFIHYGGEFICGKTEEIGKLLKECSYVFGKILENIDKMDDSAHDELVLAIAVAEYRKNALVFDACAYVYRYWTEKTFYLVSTNAFYNPVCIWHLPGEKNRGMLILFNHFAKKKAFPQKERAAVVCGIVKAKRPYPFSTAYAQMVRKSTMK